MARVILVLVVVMVGVAGTLLGYDLISRGAAGPPQLEVRASQDTIALEATEKGIDADYLWALDSSGTVSLAVYTFDGKPGTFRVLLFCNARFPEPKDFDGNPIEFTKGGTEAACSEGASEDALDDRAYQLFTLDEPTLFASKPLVAWTSSGGGARVARTPQLVGMGTVTHLPDSYPVGPNSVLSIGLSGSEREQFEYFSPGAVNEGRVELAPFLAIGPVNGRHERLNVEWSITGETVGADGESVRHSVPPALARWSEPSQQRAAEFNTLLAGVLLGIVAALLVEGLLLVVRYGWTRTKPGSRTNDGVRLKGADTDSDKA